MEKIKNKQIILCIMDGWGINNKTNYNAVAQAKTPNFADRQPTAVGIYHRDSCADS